MAVREMSCGKRMKWTKEADELISQRQLTAKELAKTLGITPHAVYNRRSKIGVRFWKLEQISERSELGYYKAQRWPASLKKYRKIVMERDNWTCVYCGRPADQVDHVIAQVHGGSDLPNNLVASCAVCNNLKGSSCAECPNWRKLIEPAS
jgi:5-methylcytosine-specific restriction endonuclease McrA